MSDYYNAVGAWFLGPRGENADVLSGLFEKALKYQVRSRKQYYPMDESPYTQSMQVSNTYHGTLFGFFNSLSLHI